MLSLDGVVIATKAAWRKKPQTILLLLTGSFIFFVVLASLYADAVVWDHDTPNGLANGRLEPVSLSHTLLRYDAIQYAHIAEYGYDDSPHSAFLPLYPLLIRMVSYLTPLSYFQAGLVVSWLALSAAVVVFFKWAKWELETLKVRVSTWMSLLAMGVFPTSFYLALGYTESLFLLLNVGAIYAYRRGRYLNSGMLAGLASLTRVQGLVLPVFFLADFAFNRPKNFKKLLPPILGVLGLGLYMFYLQGHYGNPFEFLTAQKGWGRLNSNWLQSFISSFKPLYLWYLLTFFTGLYGIWRYLGKAYFTYSLAFILLSLLSGRWDSINRYMLSLAPLFLGLVILANNQIPKGLRVAWLLSSVFLLAWSILLFANGYWVA